MEAAQLTDTMREREASRAPRRHIGVGDRCPVELQNLQSSRAHTGSSIPPVDITVS